MPAASAAPAGPGRRARMRVSSRDIHDGVVQQAHLETHGTLRKVPQWALAAPFPKWHYGSEALFTTDASEAPVSDVSFAGKVSRLALAELPTCRAPWMDGKLRKAAAQSLSGARSASWGKDRAGAAQLELLYVVALPPEN